MKTQSIKHLLLFLFIVYGKLIIAQNNQVLNPSFELLRNNAPFLGCPQQMSQSGQPDYLTQDCLGWKATTNGTSDYFNACRNYTCNSAGAVGVPDNYFGSALPYTGSAYAGIYSSSITPGGPLSLDEGREYITGQLPVTGLISGKFYKVSFMALLAQSSSVMNKLGAFLSPNDPSAPITGILSPQTPSLESTGIITNSNTWTKVSKVVQSNGAEKFITIGCFSQNWQNGVDYMRNPVPDPFAACDISQSLTEIKHFDFSYYYIDDVSVVDCCDKLDISFEASGENPGQCCYNLKFGDQEPCNKIYGIRVTIIGEPGRYPSSIVTATPNPGFYKPAGQQATWIKENPIYPGEIIGNMCVAKITRARKVLIEFLNITGVAICSQEKDLPVCQCICDNMPTTAEKNPNSTNPSICCWDLSFKNLPGGCIVKSAKVYTVNAAGAKSEYTTVTFPNAIMPAASASVAQSNIIISNYCIAKNTSQTVYVRYFTSTGDSLCEMPVDISCCTYDCNKLVRVFIPKPGLEPDTLNNCCWTMKIKNDLGSGIDLTKIIVRDAYGAPVISWNSGTTALSPQQPTAQPVDVGQFCTKGYESRLFRIQYYGKDCSGREYKICEVLDTLSCLCCTETSVVAVQTSSNPCCKDIYVLNDACDIRSIDVDAPNTGLPDNQVWPIKYPKLIGSFCNNSSGTNTLVTVRLKNQYNDTICAKYVDIRCLPPNKCCADLFGYMIADPDHGFCTCRFKIIAAQEPTLSCKIFGVRITNLGGGQVSTVPVGTGTSAINFGDHTIIGELCFFSGETGTIGTGTTQTTGVFFAKVLIEFLGPDGKTLCSQTLTQSCEYNINAKGRAAGVTGYQEVNTGKSLSFHCMPNPFTSETTFEYSLNKNTKVKLELFDSQGRIVDVIENSTRTPGTYTIKYTGSHLPKGLYIAKLTTEDMYRDIKVLIE